MMLPVMSTPALATDVSSSNTNADRSNIDFKACTDIEAFLITIFMATVMIFGTRSLAFPRLIRRPAAKSFTCQLASSGHRQPVTFLLVEHRDRAMTGEEKHKKTHNEINHDVFSPLAVLFATADPNVQMVSVRAKRRMSCETSPVPFRSVLDTIGPI
jgi:hypothetical protein